MKNILFLISYLTILLLGAVSAEAANHYVRAGATGANNGSDWNNAYTSLPASLVRGDVYYIADGAYGSSIFDDANSGTTLITIKKATVAEHGISTGWSDTFGDGQATWTTWRVCTAYWNFDGVTGGGPGSWETGFGFRLQSGSSHVIELGFGCGSNAAAADNITIQHVDIQGGGRAAGSETDLIYSVDDNDNITLRYLFLHDVSRTMILTWPAGSSGWTIEYSKFARNGNAEHREAWSAGTDDNVIVRYCLFEDIMGTGVIAIVNGNGVASNWEIYGNIMYWTGKYQDGVINSGAIVTRYDPTCPGSGICVSTQNWKVYNNVIANINNPGSGGARDVQIGQYAGSCANGNSIAVTNNIWYNNGTSSQGGKNCTVLLTNTTSGGNPFASATPWTTGNWALASPLAGTALGVPYNLDMVGATRGVDGMWDRGAIEFGSGGTISPPPSPPPAPANLRVE